MGVILDSSVIVSVERATGTPQSLIRQVIAITGEQELAVTTIGHTELVHGIYRSTPLARQQRSRKFVDDLMRELPVYPYTREAAEIAGRIDAEQRSTGVSIPYADLLIGATALSLGFSLLTANVRHFRLIPGLDVISFS